jgi:hypothetical protein
VPPQAVGAAEDRMRIDRNISNHTKRKTKAQDVAMHNLYRLLTSFRIRFILKSIYSQFSIPVNFQPNRDLPEMAMKTRHQKVLKVKPPGASVPFGRLFLLGSAPTNTQDFRRKLTAVLSADVAGYSRMMGEDEAATVKTLETYKQVMFSLIRQHRGRVIDSPWDNILAEFTSVVKE